MADKQSFDLNWNINTNDFFQFAVDAQSLTGFLINHFAQQKVGGELKISTTVNAGEGFGSVKAFFEKKNKTVKLSPAA